MESKEKSIQILDEYIENDNLKKHCKMVATAMEAYAKSLGKSDDEVDLWWVAGILHDLDWEKFPDEHPKKAVNEILPKYDYPQELLDAILAHAPDITGKKPESEIEKYLFACDELSGFINAYALLRPTGFEGMKVKSVKKNLKNKKFAAGVSREDIHEGVELIQTTLEDHIQFLINSFQEAGYTK